MNMTTTGFRFTATDPNSGGEMLRCPDRRRRIDGETSVADGLDVLWTAGVNLMDGWRQPFVRDAELTAIVPERLQVHRRNRFDKNS
jgi:hypothetical protein